jgi:hypothetical protein
MGNNDHPSSTLRLASRWRNTPSILAQAAVTLTAEKGTRKRRVALALAATGICSGGNGHLQLNYSVPVAVAVNSLLCMRRVGSDIQSDGCLSSTGRRTGRRQHTFARGRISSDGRFPVPDTGAGRQYSDRDRRPRRRFLDKGSSFGVYSRLNLYAAAGKAAALVSGQPSSARRGVPPFRGR